MKKFIGGLLLCSQVFGQGSLAVKTVDDSLLYGNSNLEVSSKIQNKDQNNSTLNLLDSRNSFIENSEKILNFKVKNKKVSKFFDGSLVITPDVQYFMKHSYKSLNFLLENKNSGKVKVEIEVKRKSIDGSYVLDTDSFNPLGHGNLIGSRDTLLVKLSPSELMSNTSEFLVTFKLTNASGRVIVKDFYIPVVDDSARIANTSFKIVNEGGISKLVPLR